jgi:hypothetical protein
MGEGTGMTRVSAQYIEGIKEGRKLLDWWKRDCFDVQSLLLVEIDQLTALRHRVAQLAGSQDEISFFDGQIAFYKNQLKRGLA